MAPSPREKWQDIWRGLRRLLLWLLLILFFTSIGWFLVYLIDLLYVSA